MGFSSERTFILWTYSVGHQYLLLRSPKGVDATNIDVLVMGVTYLEIPTTLKGMTLTREKDGIVVHSEEKDYRIAAVGLVVLENQLDIFDIGVVNCVSSRAEDFGVILARI